MTLKTILPKALRAELVQLYTLYVIKRANYCITWSILLKST